MKFYKFNSVKLAYLMTIIASFTIFFVMRSLEILVTKDMDILVRNAFILFILYLIDKSFTYAKIYSIQTSRYYIARQINSRISNYYSKISYDKFKKESIGSRVSLYVNDVMQVLRFTIDMEINMIFNISQIIFVEINLFLIDKYIFLIAFFAVIIIVFLPKLFDRSLSEEIKKGQIEKAIFSGNITGNMEGINIYKTTGAINKFLGFIKRDTERMYNQVSITEIYAGKVAVVLNFASDILVLVSLFITSYLVISKKLESAVFLTILGTVPLMGEASLNLLTNYTFYKSGKNLYKERFGELEEIYEEEYTRPIIRKLRDVYIEKVYPKKSEEIKSIKTKDLVINLGNKKIKIDDIEIKKGKKYLLIGDSGSGKSSLLKTLIGEITNYTGDIYINSKLKKNNELLYDKIAYMSQENYLFHNSVGENIKLGNDNADVPTLLNKVALNDLSADYMVEEKGKNISGGQIQKIELARTLALEKSILFLDEICANLDSKSRGKIESLIFNSDLTVVYISHNLNDFIVEKSDEIINITK